MNKEITAEFIRTRIKHLRHCARIYAERGDYRNRVLAISSAYWWRNHLRTAP